jgi:hypothetical protein
VSPAVIRKAPRFAPVLVALALAGSACATAHSFPIQRVRRADVKVLPGAGGFVNPLTGIATYTPQPWQHRRVLAVKVGNSGAERPQAGLDQADVVYEELVEGGITRFMALFLTNSAARVGPVRSVRTVDPDIAESYHALFAYSGGVPPVVARLHSAQNITDVGADAEINAFHRDSARNAPYNLYTSTDALWNGHDGSPPDPQFAFLPSNVDPSKTGAVANHIEFKFAGNGVDAKFDYNPTTGLYQRFTDGQPHMVEHAGGNQQLAFRNVIVEMVHVISDGYLDPAGNRTNTITVTGTGAAVFFRAGRAVRGHWSRSTREEPMHYTDDTGQRLAIAPGNTIVEMVPEGQSLFVT